MTEPDRIHRNAQKAMNAWDADLQEYVEATRELVEAEAQLRATRREMKDTETFMFVNGQVSGKNDAERKANLAIALRSDEAYARLSRDEAALEKAVAQHRRVVDGCQESMRMNAAILRYATEERRESAERLALEARK